MDNNISKILLRGKLIFDYDNKSDVLYAYINKPRLAICKEKNNIVLRINPKNKKIVGFTIVDFLYKILLKNAI